MIDNIIHFSIKNKLIIGLLVLGLIGWGIYSLSEIPLDAVPDITNNQIQVITQAPDLATQEVEQFITYPLEVAMSFIPDVVEIRSISRFGLSVITVVFEEKVDPYLARQLVDEQIQVAQESIPEEYGTPHMAPLVTGLSEVYQYTLVVDPVADTTYTPMQLRTLQDWIVKRQLAGVPGVAEVSSFGGYLKQYEVAIDPQKLRAYHLTLTDVYDALQNNNRNTGGSYIAKTNTYYFIRGEGMVQSLEDLGKVLIRNRTGTPILVEDVAEVQFGYAQRYGALTRNGEGEAVGGLVLMLKGENSHQVTKAIQQRVAQIQKSLPAGVVIKPFLNRSELIDRAIVTITKNLVEGGLIVIFILVLLLGNLRAGLIVASVIPLSMLFALGMMQVFGVSANLMSLGAIDFGLIVDGAVIIVEAIIHRLYSRFPNQTLSAAKMNEEVNIAAIKIRQSAAFGEIIILIVYLPILALTGIEGKMFKPMAQTVSFAILGALILSLTYVPMMSALFLKRTIVVRTTIADRIMNFFHRLYEPVIRFALHAKWLVLSIAVGLLVITVVLFSRLGGEFIPTLEEGDLALHQILPTGTSLDRSVAISTKIQKALLQEFPEIEEIVTKIGTSEIPTDPMPMEVGDIIVVLKDKKEWVSASSREALFEKMEVVMNTIPGVGTEFSQPIQMRFNELMTGVRQDIAVKIYGEDLEVLVQKAQEARALIAQVEGLSGVVVEQISGLPQIQVNYNREEVAQYGVPIQELNQAINTAFSGGYAGVVFEGEKRFDLVMRFQEAFRQDISNVQNMYVSLPQGNQVPMKELADIQLEEAPAQISRDNAKRRIVIGINTRNRDTESVVEDIQQRLEEQLELPVGYYITYGGQFENLLEARQRLSIAVPVALGLIFILLFFTFRSVQQALLIFTAVPLSAIGGVFALWLRDMPFSISAGVGFIALFGVAVLNGIVLIAYFNQLKQEGVTNLRERILKGTQVRLRPVIMTASVASLGFLPMALSTSAGAEVQRPLATVVIGGLITATLLTLVVLPVLYEYLEKTGWPRFGTKASVLIIGLLSLMASPAKAQIAPEDTMTLTLEEVLTIAVENYPTIAQAGLQVERQKALQRSVIDLGNTQLFFQREETNGEDLQGIRSLGIQQNIDFPLTYLRRSQYQKEQTALSEHWQTLTRNDLMAAVASAYNEALYTRTRLQLIRELDSLFQHFEEAALLRYETGETGKLDWIAASAKRQQIRMMLQQAQADQRIALNNLQQWLNMDQPLQVEGDFVKFETSTAFATDAAAMQNNPLLDYYRQNTAVATAALQAQRSERWPQLSVGYSAQTVNGQEGFFLYRVGVNVPLFFWAQQGRIQAAGLQKQVAEQEWKKQQLDWQREYQRWLGEKQKLMASLDYYESQGLPLAEEQMAAATQSYAAGEIGYVAYIQNIEQAMDIRQAYLRSLREYNEAVIAVKQLTGESL